MRIRNLFLYIFCFCFFSFLLVQVVLADNVGITIRKIGSIINEENLYWAYTYDTASEPSSASSSLIKLQVLTDSGLEDRFRVDKFGNLEASGEIDAHGLCIQGSCSYAWDGMAGVWTTKGDGEIYYDTNSVGIGTSDPNYTLDVRGEISVNDVQTIYVPDQVDFKDSLILGNGGNAFSNVNPNDADSNTFVGMGTGRSNTTGYRNTFVGSLCGDGNTVGDNNTFIGIYAGVRNTTGIRNVMFGGYNNTTGSYNTYMGWGSGNGGTSASGNVMLGYGSGWNNTTGSYNVYLGRNSGHSATSTSNRLYIDNTGTDTPLIEGDFDNNELYFNGYVGIGDTNPTVELSIDGGIEIGHTDICEDGVLRFDNALGEFQYCYGGTWEKFGD